jgi:hypothetical protein
VPSVFKIRRLKIVKAQVQKKFFFNTEYAEVLTEIAEKKMQQSSVLLCATLRALCV